MRLSDAAWLVGVAVFAASPIATLILVPVVKDPHPKVIARAEEQAAPKADKLAVEAPPEAPWPHAKPVKTISVAPLWRPEPAAPTFAPTEPLVAQTEFPSLPKPTATKPEPKGDVCARHGMKRKAEGRKWRCVK